MVIKTSKLKFIGAILFVLLLTTLIPICIHANKVPLSYMEYVDENNIPFKFIIYDYNSTYSRVKINTTLKSEIHITKPGLKAELQHKLGLYTIENNTEYNFSFINTNNGIKYCYSGNIQAQYNGSIVKINMGKIIKNSILDIDINMQGSLKSAGTIFETETNNI